MFKSNAINEDEYETARVHLLHWKGNFIHILITCKFHAQRNAYKLHKFLLVTVEYNCSKLNFIYDRSYECKTFIINKKVFTLKSTNLLNRLNIVYLWSKGKINFIYFLNFIKSVKYVCTRMSIHGSKFVLLFSTFFLFSSF